MKSTLTVMLLSLFQMSWTPVAVYATIKGQLEIPDFPVIPGCHKNKVNLLLISDAASESYAIHLQLLAKVIDLFSSGQETPEHLKVGMAISGSDGQDQPEISWLFHLGQFSRTSDIKRAIVEDSERIRVQNSYLGEAVKFVYDAVDDSNPDKRVSPGQTLSVTKARQESKTNTSFTRHVSESTSNSSSSDDYKLEQNETRPITLIVVLANPDLESHSYKESDPDMFLFNRKLLIVFISSKPNSLSSKLCRAYTSHPCINLFAETMLEDHSLSLALCGRCYYGWFGPMPTSEILKNQTSSDYNPALAYKSCYRLAAGDSYENYALKASEKCEALGASLVSIETKMELIFLDRELKQRCSRSRECPGNISSVFIGLRRNANSLGMRFQWVNGRPLIYSQWVKDHPKGGYIKGCVIWDMQLCGWVDIGCGRLMDFTGSLCEWTVPTSMEISEISLPASPDEMSINGAMNRGQIAICKIGTGLTEPLLIIMPAQLSFMSNLCSWHINNTGVLQVVEMPLSAELLFSCTTEFPSHVLYSNVCDQTKNCFNDNDESRELCNLPLHENTEMFTCVTSLKEVAEDSRCDLYVDCGDGSDEMGCENCRFGLCSDGRCVPQTWLTDSQQDCLTVSGQSRPDMENSINFEMDCAFLCNRSKCVPWHKLGDGVVDCVGPEGPLDETLGSLERADCGDPSSTEWAPKCIYQKDRLGELIGCRNMRHLQECEDFECPEGYIKCPKAYCMPVHYLFNDKIDCPIGEDESLPLYKPSFLEGYFKCSIHDSVFLHPDRICDGSTDCLDGTDEMGCRVTCAEQFFCAAGFVIADDYDSSEALTSVSFIDHRTRLIDFSHINASFVMSAICDLKLTYLLDLRLSNSCLTDVLGPRICFPRLSKLDLSYNLFRNISIKGPNLWPIYYGATGLHTLNFSFNAQLEFFDAATMVSNYNIKVLDLSHTALTTFPILTVSSLSLVNLNLSYTRIVQLAAFTFPFVIKPWKLEVFDLRGNEIEEIHPKAFERLEILSDFYSDFFKLCCPQLKGEGIPAHVCHAPKDPLSSCSNLIQNRLLRILVWVMGVASVLGNASVIITRLVAGRTTLRLPYAQFVTQLGVSDLLMGVYLLIIASKDVRLDGKYVLHENSWRHSHLCQTAGVLSTLSSEVSSVFILLITIDRYLVIKYPFGEHRITQNGILVYSILTWCLGLTLATVPLLPWTDHWEVYSSNAVCLGLPLLPERRAGWQFSTTVFIAFNCLLCLLIVVGQLAIYKAASATRHKVPTSSASSRDGDLSPRMKEDLNLARRLAAVAFTDLLCWLPIGILGFLALDGQTLGGEAYAWMAVFVMPVNSALNPVLYSLPVIRNYLTKVITKCIASKKKVRSRAEVNTIVSRI